MPFARFPLTTRSFASSGIARAFGLGLGLAALASSPAEAAFYNGPYLQQVTQSTVRLMWETDGDTTGTVQWGTTTAYGTTKTDSTSTTLHTVGITGLQAQTTYYYQVTDSTGDVRQGRFTTSPKAGTSFVFAAYGDNRSNPENHRAVADAIANRNPALVVTTGDYVETAGFLRSWHKQFFEPAKNLLIKTPILPAVGNHDSEVGHPRTPVWRYFPRPGTTNYYSFDYGDIHFVVVDSNIPYNASSSQYVWLKSDLETTTKPIIIAVHHFPVYSSGNHGSTVDMDNTLRPLYEQNGVTAVLNGHDHMYERSVRNGVQYFILGGGGADLYSTGDSPNPYAVKSESTHNYGIFSYQAGSLNFVAYRPDGSVIESLTLAGAGAPRPTTGWDDGGSENQDNAGLSSEMDETAMGCSGAPEDGGPVAGLAGLGAGVALALLAISRRR